MPLPLPLPHPVPSPARRLRDPLWWCPPLVAVGVIGGLYIPAFTLYAFATMATDSCGPDLCPANVTVPLISAPFLYATGACLALLSFAFPWTMRWRKARLSVAWVGTAASASVVPLLLSVML
ncbi:hypothetical protein HEK616_38020 [Streptomyces nigrescens]|uniref:Integral membrane protein n=1 Tax=Streptomyces nigrescens TaxID=1920 RepID=A0ABM7ZVD4_STRNI|nr:hypothetical protein HEK616_38020 [Streptomyces nigrescens]